LRTTAIQPSSCSIERLKPTLLGPSAFVVGSGSSCPLRDLRDQLGN
jgi:hypothetical protein